MIVRWTDSDEGKLALVIARTAHAVAEDDAYEFITGWTCANDVSAREYQFGDGQWFRGKGCDAFCPVGPRIVPRDELFREPKVALARGDLVEVEGLGVLRNEVRAAT